MDFPFSRLCLLTGLTPVHVSLNVGLNVWPPVVPGDQFLGFVSVETEYREMLFRVETEHSDKELYRIIAQSRPVQMISY